MAERPGVSPEKKVVAIQPLGDCESYLIELQMQSYWGRWIWVAIFERTSTDERESGDRPPVIIPVDGTVLEPENATPSYLLSERKGNSAAAGSQWK